MNGDRWHRRRLRVLRVYHSGVVTAWRAREDRLADHDVDVHLVCAERWNEGGAHVALTPRAGEQIQGVPTVGRHPFRFFYSPWRLWRALRDNRDVDVLDIHEEPAALATLETLALARLAGLDAPVVLYSAQNLHKRYPPPFRWFERWMLRRAVAVHTCNDQVEPVLRAKGFTAEVVNLGLGIDLGHFSPGAAGREIPVGRLQVGFVGRFTEQKGIFTLLDAIGQVDGVELTFVGAGPEEQRLREAIVARDLIDRVRIHGFVDHAELPALYRTFDVLAVPSLDRSNVREQFGRVIVEAMACGTPVITSDVGAFPSVGGDATIIVPEGDPAAVAQALVRLRDDPGSLQELRERGRERARYFSWHRIAADQAALYRRVATE